jgi:hypothetical protein
LFSLSGGEASPATEAATTAKPESDWRFINRFGLWGMSVDGDVKVRDAEADFSADFADLLKNTNFALFPGIEVGYGKWTFVYEGVITRLETEQDFQSPRTGDRGEADIVSTMIISDFAVGYTVFEGEIFGGKAWTLTPAVGLRYTHMETEIDPARFESRKRTVDLFDPIVGGRSVLQLNDKLAWRTDATIGGFGADSELTASGQMFLDWMFAEKWELNIGYRVLYYDVEEKEVEIKQTLHGPFLGVSYHW